MLRSLYILKKKENVFCNFYPSDGVIVDPLPSSSKRLVKYNIRCFIFGLLSVTAHILPFPSLFKREGDRSEFIVRPLYTRRR